MTLAGESVHIYQIARGRWGAAPLQSRSHLIGPCLRLDYRPSQLDIIGTSYRIKIKGPSYRPQQHYRPNILSAHNIIGPASYRPITLSAQHHLIGPGYIIGTYTYYRNVHRLIGTWTSYRPNRVNIYYRNQIVLDILSRLCYRVYYRPLGVNKLGNSIQALTNYFMFR